VSNRFAGCKNIPLNAIRYAAVWKFFVGTLFFFSALNLDVASASSSGDKRAKDALETGQMLMFNANPLGASAAFRKALSLDPNLWEARSELASAYERLGDLDAAIREYQELVKNRPADLSSMLALGRLLRTAAKSPQAVNVFEKACAINHIGFEPERQLAFTLIETGDETAAIERFKVLATQEPQAVQNQLGLAIAQFRNGNAAEARKALTTVLSIDAKEPTAYNLLGDLEFASGNMTDAISDYRKAIALDPRFTQAYISLGNLFLKTDSFADSDSVFAAGCENCPSNVDLTLGLAISKEKSGNLDKAIELFDSAREMRPDPSRLSEIEMHLRALRKN